MDAVPTTPLVARQHGVLSTAQLKAAGVSKGAIANRVRDGWLHPVHRGVYAVGHARLTYQGRLWAAVLATGGVFSHRAAAAVWDLMRAPAGPIDVTVSTERRSRKGIRVHRSKTLDPSIGSRRLLRRDGLPQPQSNATLLGYEPDFLWADARLIAETDGKDAHLTPTAFEDDRRRDAELLVAGYRVVRFTWAQVTEEPRRVANTLQRLL